MINWKVRFKNPVFLAQLFLAFIAPILGYFGLTAQDLTTWGSVFNLLVRAFSNPYVLFLNGFIDNANDAAKFKNKHLHRKSCPWPCEWNSVEFQSY